MYEKGSVWSVVVATGLPPHKINKILADAGVRMHQRGPRKKLVNVVSLCKDYRAGKGLVELSLIYLLSPSCLRQRLQMAGERIRRRGRPTGELRPRTPPVRDLEMQALRKKGMTQASIAKQYGLTRQAVSLILAKLAK